MLEKLQKLAGDLYCALFARPSCYLFNKMLFDLSIRGLGLLNSDNDKMSGESFFLDKILGRYASPLVLDVGANRGHYAEKVMESCPKADLYAFEPHPATFSVLQKAGERLGFKAVNCGMGSEVGSLKLYDNKSASDGSEHASLYREVIADIHKNDVAAVDVRVDTVDRFLAEHGIKHVTLLKIDTEGHEYQVLLGAAKTLADGRIDLIQIEFNEMNVVSRVFFRDFQALLGEAYDAYRLLPNGLLPLNKYRPRVCELFAFQNLLFVKRGGELPLPGVH